MFRLSRRLSVGKTRSGLRDRWSKGGWRPAQVTGPITSTYRWQGKIETAEEWQCWAKSRRDLYPQIEQAIRRLHPYQVPEILAMPILAGSADYLAWLEAETAKTTTKLE